MRFEKEWHSVEKRMGRLRWERTAQQQYHCWGHFECQQRGWKRRSEVKWHSEKTGQLMWVERLWREEQESGKMC